MWVSIQMGILDFLGKVGSKDLQEGLVDLTDDCDQLKQEITSLQGLLATQADSFG